MNTKISSAFAAATALIFLAALSSCYPSNARDLGHPLVVQGVVTDSGTGAPLAGVTVSLLSLDDFAPQKTDARGYFQFTNVLQQDNLLVQYSLTGYATVTQTVNPTVLSDAGTSDAGFAGFNDADGFDASIALSQQLTVAIAGTVYAGAVLAAGAQLALINSDGATAYQAKSGTDGTFTFAAVLPEKYTLEVLPWDRDGDGLSDTQFFSEPLDATPLSGMDLGHLAVNLSDVDYALVASSFVDLNSSYPIQFSDLDDGVSGVLQSATGGFFLTFGAEVDPSLTAFQLVQIESDGQRDSAPIALTATWSHGATVTLTPASPLVASDNQNLGYELRITSLRFADGTVGQQASPGNYATIDFTVQALPATLASPLPGLYLANLLTATQTTTHVAFDANTGWLLDANSDFVFGLTPSANWSQGNLMQLQWPSVPGAVRYHLFMRSTTSAGGNQASTLDWREQTNAVLQLPDPGQTQPVIATGVNPWTTLSGLTSDGPWAFGNHVQFAITSEDALGFTSAIDTTKVLDTADTFGGFITSSTADALGLPAPFTLSTELGNTFTKTLRLVFSEPMLASSQLALVSQGARATIKNVLATAWTNGGAIGSAPNSGATVYLSLQLQTPGTCTEVTLARAAGDTLLPVRDASYFTASASSTYVFLTSAGQLTAQGIGFTAVDTTANQLTLSIPLANGVSLASGSYICSLQGASVGTVAAAPTSATITVASAAPFAVGDSVLLFEPQNGSTAPVADFSTIAGVDTQANSVVLSAAPAAGHTTASLLLRMPPFGGEIALRGASPLTLAKDVAGGAGAQLVLNAPASGLAVGDVVLVDADGDLATTDDQAQVKVTQLSFAPTAVPAVYSFSADLPATMTLLHGRSKVIALGDVFSLSGTVDTSGNTTLDPHADQFTFSNAQF